LPEAAATEAADALQDATVNLEAARAAHAETLKPPTQSEIQAATADAQSAQAALDDLLLQPTPAEVAAAQAAVAEAEAAIQDIEEGPQQGVVRQAELGVRSAMIALENARLAQAGAQVVAPIDGKVLAINVDLGQQAEAGDVVAVLADTADVKLTVNVEQRDISRVIIGQEVQIAIYALASDTFTGVVEQIAPVADAETGFVTFPVIIRFTSGPLEKVLPGMTASATFMPADGEAPTPAATTEATEEATTEPTEEATDEPDAESTEEPTAESTEATTPEPTEEASEEATPPATEEATEEAADATPSPDAEETATPSN
jgi:HlyD family secretion protein